MSFVVWIFAAGFFGFIAGALLGESFGAAVLAAATAIVIVCVGEYGG